MHVVIIDNKRNKFNTFFIKITIHSYIVILSPFERNCLHSVAKTPKEKTDDSWQ